MSLLSPSATVVHSAVALVIPAGCAGLLLLAAARDVASRTIPNSIPLLLTVLGFALQVQGGSLPAALLASGLVFVVCAAGWRIGLMGGGDVKLLAALAFCVPPAAVLSLITATTLAGGALGIVYLVLRRLPRVATPMPATPALRTLPARVLRVEWWRIGRGSPLPYGVAIALGGLLTIF